MAPVDGIQPTPLSRLFKFTIPIRLHHNKTSRPSRPPRQWATETTSPAGIHRCYDEDGDPFRFLVGRRCRRSFGPGASGIQRLHNKARKRIATSDDTTRPGYVRGTPLCQDESHTWRRAPSFNYGWRMHASSLAPTPSSDLDGHTLDHGPRRISIGHVGFVHSGVKWGRRGRVLGNCFGTRSATASTRYVNDTLLLQERCFQKCGWAGARQPWGTPARCTI